MLFGYSDGHRLIASSIKLSEDTISLLLPLSDLSPGITVTREYGYWTGVPLKAEKFYALMYTWAAPEMPRPGCVWTQVLLLPFSDISRFSNLSSLRQYFNTIEPSIHSISYENPVEIHSFELQEFNQNLFLDLNRSTSILRSIYSNNSYDVVGQLGEYDDELFAVWSQQWPKLRRSFSFRSAIKFNNHGSSISAFDFCIKIGHESFKESYSNLLDWEVVAAKSLNDPAGNLQKFLWRYGSDIKRGINKFSILVDLFLELHRNNYPISNLHKIVKTINDGFPNIADARTLKTDIFDHNEYSLITTYSPIDVFRELAKLESELSEISFPVSLIIEKLKVYWEKDISSILDLMEFTVDANSYLAKFLVDEFMEIILQGEFFILTKNFPNLRKFIIFHYPYVLDSDEIVSLPKTEILQAAGYISSLPDELKIDIILRLLMLDDIEISHVISGFYFDSLILAVIKFMNNKGQIDRNIGRCWIDVMMNRSDQILKGGYIQRSESTVTLAFFASLLSRWSFDLVLNYGVHQWVTGLINSVDNVSSHDRKCFLVFLLKMGFSCPIGSEMLFEFSFEEIYDDLKSSSLSFDQLYDLQFYLPVLSFFSNWDNCLRFKLAVVNAYISNELSFSSFERLSKNYKLQNELNELARSI